MENYSIYTTNLCKIVYRQIEAIQQEYLNMNEIVHKMKSTK